MTTRPPMSNERNCAKCGERERNGRGDCLPCERARDRKRWEVRGAGFHRRYRARIHAARARRYGVPGTFTDAEWFAVVERQGGKCADCGKPGELEVDHIIPLRLRGTNFIENIQGLCHDCNRTKRNRDENPLVSLYKIQTGRKSAPRTFVLTNVPKWASFEHRGNEAI